MLTAAWLVVALGALHCVLGVLVFRRPIAAAVSEGLVGKFAGVPERRLAFWFTIFGPLLLMAGHVAVIAAESGNTALLRVVGIYLMVVSMVGVVALPKSPFAVTILLAAYLVVGTMLG